MTNLFVAFLVLLEEVIQPTTDCTYRRMKQPQGDRSVTPAKGKGKAKDGEKKDGKGWGQGSIAPPSWSPFALSP